MENKKRPYLNGHKLELDYDYDCETRTDDQAQGQPCEQKHKGTGVMSGLTSLGAEIITAAIMVGVTIGLILGFIYVLVAVFASPAGAHTHMNTGMSNVFSEPPGKVYKMPTVKVAPKPVPKPEAKVVQRAVTKSPAPTKPTTSLVTPTPGTQAAAETHRAESETQPTSPTNTEFLDRWKIAPQVDQHNVVTYMTATTTNDDGVELSLKWPLRVPNPNAYLVIKGPRFTKPDGKPLTKLANETALMKYDGDIPRSGMVTAASEDTITLTLPSKHETVRKAAETAHSLMILINDQKYIADIRGLGAALVALKRAGATAQENHDLDRFITARPVQIGPKETTQ